MGSVIPLALSLALSAALNIRGGATCPTPAEVAQRAVPLLAPGGGLSPGLILRVDEIAVPEGSSARGLGEVAPTSALAPIAAPEIEVRLERDGAASAVLASRRLARNVSCRELAEAAAVVIASWAGTYETPAPKGLTLPDGPSPEVVLASAPGATAPPAAHRTAWSIGGAGWAGAANEGGVTPFAGVELTATWRGGPWFARMMAAGSGERLFPVANGNAAWRRALFIPTLGRVWGESIFFEASGGPVVGPVFVRGQGFSPNQDDVGLAVGVSPSLRVGFRLGRTARTSLWLGAAAVAWVRPHKLAVDMTVRPAMLPWLDVLAGGGVSYAFDH